MFSIKAVVGTRDVGHQHYSSMLSSDHLPSKYEISPRSVSQHEQKDKIEVMVEVLDNVFLLVLNVQVVAQERSVGVRVLLSSSLR